MSIDELMFPLTPHPYASRNIRTGALLTAALLMVAVAIDSPLLLLIAALDLCLRGTPVRRHSPIARLSDLLVARYAPGGGLINAAAGLFATRLHALMASSAAVLAALGSGSAALAVAGVLSAILLVEGALNRSLGRMVYDQVAMRLYQRRLARWFDKQAGMLEG